MSPVRPWELFSSSRQLPIDGVVPKDAVLNAETLLAVKMPKRDGYGALVAQPAPLRLASRDWLANSINWSVDKLNSASRPC